MIRIIIIFMDSGYRFVYRGGTDELVVKRSRFIATVAPVSSETEALSFIEKTKKKYWDARHNCTAFTVGLNHSLTRSSDDGEPAGTAGHPMLDVLLGADVHDAAVVVTRYFGGTLLGTGGLVRAYSEAVRLGLAASVILKKQLGTRLLVTADYSDYGKIQYLTGEWNITVLNSSFTDTVFLDLLAPSDVCEAFTAAATGASCGRAVIKKGREQVFAVSKDGTLLFDSM